MPKLIIQNDQTGATGREEIIFPAGTTAVDMLMKELPGGIDPESTHVYVRMHQMVLPNDKSNGSPELLEPLGEHVIVTVIHEAKGFDPITLAYIAVAALVAAVAVVALAPSIPGDAGTGKESPNNSLFGQTNIARPYQAYPLIFGSPRPYPDLGGEPVNEYIDNQKIVKQFMCIGVGLFDITEVRAGETPLLNFSGASFNVLEPVNKNTIVPELVISFATNEIDGQELLGTNEGVDGDTFDPLVENTVGTLSLESNFFQFAIFQDAQSDLLKAAFDAAPVGAYIIEVDYNRRVIVSGFPNFEAAVGSGVVLDMVLVAHGGGNYYQIGVEEFTGEEASASGSPQYLGPFSVTEKDGAIVGPTRTRLECEELWFDIIFNRGLKGNVDIRIETQELAGLDGVPIGPVTTTDISFTENTLDQQFFTHKEVLASKAFYQFTVRRTNNATQDSAKPDIAQLEAVSCINTFFNREFGNVSIIEIEIPATENATSLRENQINLSCTSKLITYENGAVNFTVQASRKMADALLHLYVEFFGLDPNTLALEELYAIQDRLDAIDPRLANFDFTFDDIDVSLDERMDAILQVARCYKWLDGDVYRFARDDAREFEATLITRQDITAEDNRDYSVSYNPQLLEAFNAVKIQYVDTLTNKKAYIFRTFDINSPDPQNPVIIDATNSNPRTMELAGCQEEYNAINRAELEIRKLIYQRYTMSDTFLPSGMLLDKGDMLLYAEQYNIESNLFDGEIRAVVGNIASTTEHIDFIAGQSYQVHYTLNDGTQVGPFPVFEVAGQPFKFECASLSQAYVRDSVLGFNIQAGSRYIISTFEELDAARWSVIDKEASGSNVQVTMVNYDDRVFEFDTIQQGL